MEVTQWFDGYMKPVHVGWYESQTYGDMVWFDGCFFSYVIDDCIYLFDRLVWRGRVKSPCQ